MRIQLDIEVPEHRIVWPEEFLAIWEVLQPLFWHLAAHDINPCWGDNLAGKMSAAYTSLKAAADSLAKRRPFWMEKERPKEQPEPTKLTAISINGKTAFIRLPVDPEGKVHLTEHQLLELLDRLGIPRNHCIAVR